MRNVMSYGNICKNYSAKSKFIERERIYYIYIYVNIPKEHAKGKVNKNLQDTDKIKTKMTGSGIHYRPLRSSSSEIPRLCEEVGRKHMLI